VAEDRPASSRDTGRGPAATAPGRYPGKAAGKNRNRWIQAGVFAAGEGTIYAAENRVPLWIGEFGAAGNDGRADVSNRPRALDDQIAVGAVGPVTVDPRSRYMKLTRGYFAGLMQPAFAERFKGLGEDQIDDARRSFAFDQCRVETGLVDVLKQYWSEK
jgi:hypothetical protein